MKTFCIGIDCIKAEFYHVTAETEEEAREKLASYVSAPTYAETDEIVCHAENDAEYDLDSIRAIDDFVCITLESPEKKK